MKKTRPIGEFGKIGNKQVPGAMPGIAPGMQALNSPGIQQLLPSDSRKRQTLYLPAELAKWLKLHSVAVERDMSEIVTELIQEYRTRVMSTSQHPERKS